MENLIKALQILLKYGNPKYPTCCEHDTLYICGIKFSDVSAEDIEKLEELGFNKGDDDNFYSFRYGSA